MKDRSRVNRYTPTASSIPAFHAFGPYVTCALLLIAACFIEIHTAAPPLTTALHLALQVVAILTMRAIGLFYRHYACYFKW